MIHWKNRPIDQLSKGELQDALKESVGLMLDNTRYSRGSETLHTFTFGVAAGVAVSLLGMSISWFT